ncbi:hypothetical protein C493_10683 [Natronolimnohabitans innermongolicus JCM 12255]|uniref:Uncharacterized protein n=1 Tax=Natronolimnohabitans innermongolicus JCM 12255 TaxID=1227499 RepID=L9X5S2_9EURY|nr:hypothetical protein C493_10683 [Natronolimnohabitans innermongolicus JCM 12255]
MSTQTRSRGAASCTECGRVLAVWLSSEGEIHPIGSVNGCPCGSTSFRPLRSSLGSNTSDGPDVAVESRDF